MFIQMLPSGLHLLQHRTCTCVHHHLLSLVFGMTEVQLEVAIDVGWRTG